MQFFVIRKVIFIKYSLRSVLVVFLFLSDIFATCEAIREMIFNGLLGQQEERRRAMAMR
jgi:hypothetical protein